MGYEIENTLTSFQKAIDLNVDMIELDLLTSKHGRLIVFHDHKLDRITEGKGHLRKKTLEELKKLNVHKKEKIPTLEEALDLIDRKAKVNIEIKGAHTIGALLRLIDHYIREKGWRYDDFIISSFSRKTLKKLYQTKPHIQIGALVRYRLVGFLKFARSVDAYSVHIHKNLINKRLVAQARKKGFQVYVWTVNKPEEIDKVKNLGVDGIFSDFPDRI